MEIEKGLHEAEAVVMDDAFYKTVRPDDYVVMSAIQDIRDFICCVCQRSQVPQELVVNAAHTGGCCEIFTIYFNGIFW